MNAISRYDISLYLDQTIMWNCILFSGKLSQSDISYEYLYYAQGSVHYVIKTQAFRDLKVIITGTIQAKYK